jgi:hypothetical protein
MAPINYDESKLVIGLDHLDIDGFQLYHLLKEKYEIMMELAETYAVLGIFAIGTKQEHVENLLSCPQRYFERPLSSRASLIRITISIIPSLLCCFVHGLPSTPGQSRPGRRM